MESTMAEEKKIDLAALRAELGVSQRDLGKESNTAQAFISHIENGRPITRQTALKLFFAINRLRQARGLTPIEWKPDEWNLTSYKKQEEQ